MRYTEPKARSAELLRMTLAHMGRHAAAFNPITFTLWYEYGAGINPKLNQALDALSSGDRSITDDDVMQLYLAHVSPPDRDAVTRIGLAMQEVMSSVVQSATQTGLRAGTYGEQLSGLSRALARPADAQITPRLNEVLAGMAEMQDAVLALQRRMRDSQSEIDSLRGDLVRARDAAGRPDGRAQALQADRP